MKRDHTVIVLVFLSLQEESAKILSTGSELLGVQTRSCKDETFLSTEPLKRKIESISEYMVYGGYFPSFYPVFCIILRERERDPEREIEAKAPSPRDKDFRVRCTFSRISLSCIAL